MDKGPTDSGKVLHSTLVPPTPFLLDERHDSCFRNTFGAFLQRCTEMDAAILSVRLGAVDLSPAEVSGIHRMRVLLAEVNARTLEGEAYALTIDCEKRRNLHRIMGLLKEGTLHLRAAPLGGWSPDFSIFSHDREPGAVLLGLHWFRRPFPHRGPAWAVGFGPAEARLALRRFQSLWDQAHDIGAPVLGVLERVCETVASPRGRENRAGADKRGKRLGE